MASNDKSFTNTKLYILVLPRVCPLYILGFTVKVLREVREQRVYYKLIKAELIETLRTDVGVDLTKSTSADLSMFKSKPAGFKFLNRRSHFFLNRQFFLQSRLKM